MVYTIKSGLLAVSVSGRGAELQSVRSAKTGTEYLWQGDGAFWGYRAPILFPAIGRLKNGSYSYGGKTYGLPKHGFVRRAEFSRVSHGQGGLELEYADCPETRGMYPFGFALRVAFALEGNTLRVENRVINRTDGEMFFGLGAHEAYRCPRNEGEAFDDYFVEFEHEGTYKSHGISANGLFTGESFTVLENGRVLPLAYRLFESDALIFKNIFARENGGAQKISIKSKKSPSVVEVAYDAPHLGIWTKPGAPFICIEPWCGLPDSEDSSGKFDEKEGNIRLGRGEEFVFSHSITVLE